MRLVLIFLVCLLGLSISANAASLLESEDWIMDPLRAQVLLDVGADPNEIGPSKRGELSELPMFQTPLTMAVRDGQGKNLEVVEVLLAAGADPTVVTDPWSNTAAHMALDLLRSPSFLYSMAKAAGTIDIRGYYGVTPFGEFIGSGFGSKANAMSDRWRETLENLYFVLFQSQGANLNIVSYSYSGGEDDWRQSERKADRSATGAMLLKFGSRDPEGFARLEKALKLGLRFEEIPNSAAQTNLYLAAYTQIFYPEAYRFVNLFLEAGARPCFFASAPEGISAEDQSKREQYDVRDWQTISANPAVLQTAFKDQLAVLEQIVSQQGRCE